ncbi:3-oxoacyl-[acyl-carrier-protein] reductase FabG-like [Oppia nitens]|uniref:3-oxoacyl-[acyl-carrier-protein] reductase FabG-like n=1 Tax=Oppia nitens TaxID=1686743 RepID=UPI0023DC403B|nr:3-oxoacyl-[acyl-carrier-protein] reductase FabG-like [Oppia nitens]
MKVIIQLISLLLVSYTVLGDFSINEYRDVLNSRNFTGKVVLVTGSNSGIGEGIVKLFALMGANVVITGRNESRIASVAQEVQQLSPKNLRPLAIRADLLVKEDVDKLFDETIKRFGRLDVLVNNAGIFPVDNITDDNLMAHWDLVFNTNLRPSVQLIHKAVPYLIKTNGSIVDISSVAGLRPTAPQLAYSTSKAAIDMFTKILALELGPLGVRVNTVNPGAIVTAAITDGFGQALKFMTSKTPLRRPGYPLDIAKGVVFLASSDAKYITGNNLVIDGGVEFNYPGYFQ